MSTSTEVVKTDPILSELESIYQLAKCVASSGLWGVRSAEQAVALMALCRAEGLPAAKAVQLYHIIDGRPAMRADAMLARFLDAGGRVEWHDYTDEQVSATFSHPQGGSVRVTWDRSRADRAGYLQRSPTWRTHTRAMLRARCISEGVRTVCPGVVCGIYTPEEIKDDMADLSRPVDVIKASIARLHATRRGQAQTQAQAEHEQVVQVVAESHAAREEQSTAEQSTAEQSTADAPSQVARDPHAAHPVDVEAVHEEPSEQKPPSQSAAAQAMHPRVAKAIEAAESAKTAADAKAAIRKLIDAISIRSITRREEAILEEAISRMRKLAGYE
jgi:hypothetical protein